jgi:alpha-tubulin suppressor-like RCC1 family protein
LWAWGFNGSGQLGLGNFSQTASPVQVGTATNWQSVAAGSAHAAAIKKDGTLWVWGQNNDGQLGLGNQINTNTPTQIGSATNWLVVTATSASTLALKTDGTVWGWGTSDSGTILAVSTPVSLAGTLGSLPIISAAAGDNHSVVVKSDGTLWAWGLDSSGQLGDNTNVYHTAPEQIGTVSNWLSVSAGSGYSMGIRADGSLWAWGANSSGQFGNGGTVQSFVPVQTGIGASWQAVSAGGGFTLAIRADGTLWSWGNNGSGQLGVGNTTQNSSPQQVGTANNWVGISAGSSSAAAVKSDGTIWCWGFNGNGQLGIGNTSQSNSPAQVGTGTNWQSVATGGSSVLALRKDGTLWAWGYNGNGQLGIGNTSQSNSPAQVGTGTNWLAIVAGASHCAGLKTDGTLWVWGAGSGGQMADGTLMDRTSPEPVGDNQWTSVFSGSQARHTLGQHNGFLWTFGSDQNGQIPGGDFGRVVPAPGLPSRSAQTVTVTSPTPQVNVPITLTTMASSGLPVSLAVHGPATLSNNVLTPTAGGAISIDAWQAGDNNAWLSGLTNVTLLVLAPNIAVLGAGGNTLLDGGTYDFSYVPQGFVTSATFTITNSGLANLTGLNITIDGANAGDYSVSAPASTTVLPGGSTTFTVNFTAQTNYVGRTATIHIASNVSGTNNPFNLALTGEGLSFAVDSDGDGMSDAQELLLAPLGFNWQVSQSALVSLYFATANSAGLYTSNNIASINAGVPVLMKDPVSGAVTIHIGWQQSTNLTGFVSLPMSPGPQAIINSQGQLQSTYQATNAAGYYRAVAQ